MKKVVVVRCLGFDPCPWSVPNVGTSTARDGRRFRFARRDKKSKPALGVLNLHDWQDAIREAAGKAMGERPVLSGPARLHYDFYKCTPKGGKHGQPWVCGVKWNVEKGAWSKVGRSEPDLTNLTKGAEDALQGVVLADDCLVTMASQSKWYGPSPGVIISVYAIEPGDFPGE